MYLKKFTFAANLARKKVYSSDARAKFGIYKTVYFLYIFYVSKPVIGMFLGNELKTTQKPGFGKHKNNFNTFFFVKQFKIEFGF